MIIQGDQYYLPFTITDGETNITPQIASDVRIKFGELEFTYSKEEILFKDGKWHCKLTQSDTLNMPKFIDAQVQVKFPTEPETIKNSIIKRIPIQKSIINEVWA